MAEELETDHRQLGLDMAQAIARSWSAMIQQKRDRQGPRRPHATVFAGGWRACDRRLVYEMCMPDAQPAFDVDTLAKFERANDRERELLIDLQRVGRINEPQFEVVGQQERFELKDKTGRVVISGKTDARLKCRELNINAPLEIKAWHPNLVSRIKSFSDLLDNTWTRSGAHQLLCYMFGANEPIGFMLLDRPGLPQPLPVSLYDHLDLVEGFLRRAAEAVAHVGANTFPSFHDDPAECRRCPFFGTICQPPIAYDGAVVVTDDEILEELQRYWELRPFHKSFEAVEKMLKARFRDIEYAIAGEYLITGKYGKNTTYDLPDQIKEKYRKSDPRGKFTTTIVRLAPEKEAIDEE